VKKGRAGKRLIYAAVDFRSPCVVRHDQIDTAKTLWAGPLRGPGQ
jgi:hypothetical protein